MRRAVGSTIGMAVTGAVIAVAVVLFGVDRTDLVLDAYLVYVGALVALAAARIATRAFPAPRRTVPSMLIRTQRRYSRPESLAAMEEVVALAQADEFDVHFRLRPVLTEITAAGLASRAGIDLPHEPQRAEARLSPATWELVRPDRQRPEDAGARGIATRSLEEIVTELESLFHDEARAV